MPSASATCQISIRGSFDVLWADYLGDMLLHADVEAGQVRTTTLFGNPPDLAAFIGVLSLLRDFGFPVIGCAYCQNELEVSRSCLPCRFSNFPPPLAHSNWRIRCLTCSSGNSSRCRMLRS